MTSRALKLDRVRVNYTGIFLTQPMHIDGDFSIPWQEEREKKPFDENVRTALGALRQSQRLRVSAIVACLQQHGCRGVAAEALAALSWQGLPPGGRNGAHYRGMCITDVRFCEQDPSKMIITAHPQHLSVRGERIAEFPDEPTELVFHNTQNSAGNAGNTLAC